MANRLLTINIRNYLVKQPRRKRPARIARYVRYKIARATKMRLESVRITGELNQLILKKHLHSMMPLKVNINVEKDKATASPFGEKGKQATVASTATTKSKPAEAGAKVAATAQKQEVKGIPVPKADAKDSKK
jgi:ribosomal protein L31E